MCFHANALTAVLVLTVLSTAVFVVNPTIVTNSDFMQQVLAQNSVNNSQKSDTVGSFSPAQQDTSSKIYPERLNSSSTNGTLLIAFPISNDTLHLVFSKPLDRTSAEKPESYFAKSGLKIFNASWWRNDPRHVVLKTEPMDGNALKIDAIRAVGVRTSDGSVLTNSTSPEFIQGLASIERVLTAHSDLYPFSNPFVGKVATMTCAPPWEANYSTLLGFSYLQEERGGPYSSIKVVTDLEKHIPNAIKEARKLPPGQVLHLVWAGGVIKEIGGQTQLVDTGYMEGYILPPLKSPPPYPIKLSDITGQAARTETANSLEAVTVEVKNATVNEITEQRDSKGSRLAVLSDSSGAKVNTLLLSSITLPINEGQRFSSITAIVDRPNIETFQLLILNNGDFIK